MNRAPGSPSIDIFAHVLERLKVTPEQTVFVDDLAHNVAAAQALGLVGVHHTSYDTTAAELEEIFGVHLRD